MNKKYYRKHYGQLENEYMNSLYRSFSEKLVKKKNYRHRIS